MSRSPRRVTILCACGVRLEVFGLVTMHGVVGSTGDVQGLRPGFGATERRATRIMMEAHGVIDFDACYREVGRRRHGSEPSGQLVRPPQEFGSSNSWTCRKCHGVFTIRHDRLQAAVARATAAGLRSLQVGVDL